MDWLWRNGNRGRAQAVVEWWGKKNPHKLSAILRWSSSPAGCSSSFITAKPHTLWVCSMNVRRVQMLEWFREIPLIYINLLAATSFIRIIIRVSKLLTSKAKSFILVSSTLLNEVWLGYMHRCVHSFFFFFLKWKPGSKTLISPMR